MARLCQSVGLFCLTLLLVSSDAQRDVLEGALKVQDLKMYFLRLITMVMVHRCKQLSAAEPLGLCL